MNNRSCPYCGVDEGEDHKPGCFVLERIYAPGWRDVVKKIKSFEERLVRVENKTFEKDIKYIDTFRFESSTKGIVVYKTDSEEPVLRLDEIYDNRATIIVNHGDSIEYNITITRIEP